MMQLLRPPASERLAISKRGTYKAKRWLVTIDSEKPANVLMSTEAISSSAPRTLLSDHRKAAPVDKSFTSEQADRSRLASERRQNISGVGGELLGFDAAVQAEERQSPYSWNVPPELTAIALLRRLKEPSIDASLLPERLFSWSLPKGQMLADLPKWIAFINKHYLFSNQRIRAVSVEFILESIPNSIPESTPDSISESIPESILKPIPKSIPKFNPEFIPALIPKAIPEFIPESGSQY